MREREREGKGKIKKKGERGREEERDGREEERECVRACVCECVSNGRRGRKLDDFYGILDSIKRNVYDFKAKNKSGHFSPLQLLF